MSVIVSNISDFFETLLSIVAVFLSTIQSNPVLWASVLFALFGGIAVFAVSLIRKIGVRGLASSGRRRRIRR